MVRPARKWAVPSPRGALFRGAGLRFARSSLLGKGVGSRGRPPPGGPAAGSGEKRYPAPGMGILGPMAHLGSPHYAYVDLGDEILVAVARLDGDGICNSGLVGLGSGGIVFDTGLTTRAARDLRGAFDLHFHRPPTLVANSHRHMDHILGNGTFAGLPIWGTRRTREILLERIDSLSAELRRDQLENDIRELEAQRGEARTDSARADVDLFLQIGRALLNSAEEARIVPPDQTFESRLPLDGRAGTELRSFGSGHTEADAVLFLSRERILFTGDLALVGVQPSMGSGHPRHWLEVLDELDRLGAERIVPGHGPVAGPEAMDETRQYVAAVLEAAEAPPTRPLPGPLRPWEGSPSLRENLRFVRDWLARTDSRP